MLQDAFSDVYMKFKLHFYQKVFERLMDREATLTTVETFCMEIIYALNNPTVAEFAKVANISSPNAAYKINNLVKKGYLKKVQSESDKREYHLQVTEKYLNYYNISYNYMNEVMDRIEARFEPEQVEDLVKILEIMAEELHRKALDVAFGETTTPLLYTPMLERLGVGYASIGFERSRNVHVNLLKFLVKNQMVQKEGKGYVYNKTFHYTPVVNL